MYDAGYECCLKARAGLRLRSAPRLRVILVPLTILYMAVFYIFHASPGAHWEVGAPLRDWCPRLQLFQPIKLIRP